MTKILRLALSYLDNIRLNRLSSSLINLMSRQNYAHGLSWFGVPIFQTPTDLYVYQEIIFKVKPRVIIETGVAKGGSVLFVCQLLDLIHSNDKKNDWKIICSDINSLEDAIKATETFGYSERIEFFRGDSASSEFREFTSNIILSMNKPKVLLSLDSNHTEQHVLAELEQLGNFVSDTSYAIVWDSRISDLSWLTHLVRPRAWSKRKHAGTGAAIFMEKEGPKNRFIFDDSFENRLRISGVKNGILLRRDCESNNPR